MPGSDQLWVFEYAADHAELRREKELKRRRFCFQSPQINHRTTLVRWMGSVSERFKFSTTTVHLAVYVLDLFMDNHFIDLDRLHLVALVCLHLAAKYEERDVRNPKVSELNSIVKNRYLLMDFQTLETIVLHFLNWGLDLPTASHFVEYYSLFAVTRVDWQNCAVNLSYENFWESAQNILKDFLNISILDIRMLYFLPSMIACACILITRMSLKLSPKWTDTLVTVTQYRVEDLSACAETLLECRNSNNVARKRKVVDSPDHGYSTSGSLNNSPEGVSAKRSFKETCTQCIQEESNV